MPINLRPGKDKTMKEHDRPVFNAKIACLLNMYSHKSFNRDVADYYWELFQPYSIEKFLNAIDKHVMKKDNGAFFPKPCDILEHIESADDTPLLAWLLVDKASKCQLWKYNITFNDKVTHFVIDSLGGFYKMFHPDGQYLTDRQRPFLQAEFIKRYKLCSKNILPDVDMIIICDKSSNFVFDLSTDGFVRLKRYLFDIKINNLKKMQTALSILEAKENPLAKSEAWQKMNDINALAASIEILKRQIEAEKKPLKLVSGL